MGGAQERACRVHAACMWRAQRACSVHVACMWCARGSHARGGERGDAPANLAARKSCGDALRSSWSMWCCAKMAHLAPRLSQASPLVGCSCCVSRCRSVDLPAPFGLRSYSFFFGARGQQDVRRTLGARFGRGARSFPWRERVLRAACWPRVGRVEEWAWRSGPGGEGRGGWPVVAHVQRRPAPRPCHSLPPGSGARAPRCARRARRRAAARAAAARPWPGCHREWGSGSSRRRATQAGTS